MVLRRESERGAVAVVAEHVGSRFQQGRVGWRDGCHVRERGRDGVTKECKEERA